jgi:hypothetical protein
MSQVLGALFAVLVGLMIIPTFGKYQQISNDNSRAVAAAQQQQQLAAAATAYIQQYSSSVEAAATASTPAVITVPMLQSTNLLPASFSSTNPYGQTWQVEVLQPSAGNLQALVMSTGGTALNDTQASKIASLVGAAGGFLPSNDSGLYQNNKAYGSYSGWTLPTAGYTNASGGHLASIVSYNSNQAASSYLYRNAVPGQPQLNQMNTALNMGNNNINNASQVGIGTATPNAPLEIDNNTANSWSMLTRTGSGGANPSGLWNQGDNSVQLALRSGSGNLSVVTSNGDSYLMGGNLGIGTTTPSGGTGMSGGLGINGTGGTQLVIGKNGAPGLALNTSQTTAGDWTMYDKVGGNWHPSITSSNGNIGIGTATPQTMLNVNGTISVPGGNNLQVGSTYYYGDTWNSAVRQNGWFYVQTPSGSYSNALANDYWINSVGRWASQMSASKGLFAIQNDTWDNGSGGGSYTTSWCRSANPLTGGCWCPGGSTNYYLMSSVIGSSSWDLYQCQ